MMTARSTILISLFALSFSIEARTPRSKRTQTASARRYAEPSRRPNSVGSSESSVRTASDSDLLMSVSALTGVSATSGNSPLGNESANHFEFGFLANFRAWEYLGGEFEFHYGNFASGGGQRSSQANESVVGMFGNLTGHLPVGTRALQFVPKIGFGYGYGSFQGGNGLSASATGLGAVFGADINISNFSLMGDYVYSFAASGSATADALNIPFSEVSVSRLRLGAMYRVLPNLGLGVQYIHRLFSTAIAPISGLTSETVSIDLIQNQYMGVLQYDF